MSNQNGAAPAYEAEYEIVVARTGTVRVKAPDLPAAMAKANALPAEAIKWDDGFAATDGEEYDPYGTLGS